MIRKAVKLLFPYLQSISIMKCQYKEKMQRTKFTILHSVLKSWCMLKSHFCFCLLFAAHFWAMVKRRKNLCLWRCQTGIFLHVRQKNKQETNQFCLNIQIIKFPDKGKQNYWFEFIPTEVQKRNQENGQVKTVCRQGNPPPPPHRRSKDIPYKK